MGKSHQTVDSGSVYRVQKPGSFPHEPLPSLYSFSTCVINFKINGQEIPL